MGHVVLLGAGFSRALSDRMPLLPELGEQVVALVEGAGAADLAEFDGNVEEYLTYIGNDQPWLTDEENLRHRALFSETVAALRQVIVRAERNATEAVLPDWLERVAWQWSVDRTAVLTFNYDTLLEEPLRRAGGIQTLADLYVVPLVERNAPGHGAMFAAGEPSRACAELFKLHGSTNWLHGGDTAPITDPMVLDYRDRFPTTAPRGHRVYGGLRTFIIPPTSVKNRYYDRTALREQWIQAARRLQSADRLTVIGYSLPASDVGSSTFLRTNLNARARVEVVDLSADVANRLGALLARPVCWYDSIDSWADDRIATRVEWWVTNEQPEGSEPHLEVNGLPQPLPLATPINPAEFEAWIRETFALTDVQRMQPRDTYACNVGRIVSEPDG